MPVIGLRSETFFYDIILLPTRNSDTMKQTRPPLVRMQYIDQQLRENTYPNCSRVARHFEVSSKSIQRDVDYMRDLLQAPIEFDSKRNGFFYSKKEWTFLPSTTLDRQEADALIITKKVLSQYQGTPYYNEVNRALDKVLQYLPGRLLTSKLSEIYSFETFSPSAIEPRFFAVIEDAIRNELKINLTYRAFWNQEITERTLQPYRLHFSHSKENWTLIGYCELRKEIRSFIVSRIKNVSLTTEHFTIPVSFSMERYLEETFDQIHEEKTHDVAICFNSYQAQWIKEHQWHSTQQIEEQNDGSVILRLRIGALDALMHWVMRYGREAEVLAPVELREMIKEELKNTMEIYKAKA